jgi:hypothetical protein
MTDLNRYFPVLSKVIDNEQIGWSFVDHGKIAIAVTAPLLVEMLETRVQTEDLTALYLDIELKSFADRQPIRGTRTK